MKKEIELLERKIESLEPGTIVKLDALFKDIKKAQIKEAAIMLLNKYGIEYKE